MSDLSTDAPSFPRLYARTLRFTLGVPRSLSVSADGSRVLFLRSPSGTSRTTACGRTTSPTSGSGWSWTRRTSWATRASS
jgi:hypothetical protein